MKKINGKITNQILEIIISSQILEDDSISLINNQVSNGIETRT